MPKLEIKGKKSYIQYLARHLKKEHPSTKKRMEVELSCKKKRSKKK